MKWRFEGSEEDGVAWLENPHELTAWIEYGDRDQNGVLRTFRIMVATRGWMERQLQGVRLAQTGPLFACIQAVGVLPDATGVHLRGYIDQAIMERAFSGFGTEVR